MTDETRAEVRSLFKDSVHNLWQSAIKLEDFKLVSKSSYYNDVRCAFNIVGVVVGLCRLSVCAIVGVVVVFWGSVEKPRMETLG